MTQLEVKRILGMSKLTINQPDKFYRCKGCRTTFHQPDFYFSQSQLMMASCPNCGKLITGV